MSRTPQTDKFDRKARDHQTVISAYAAIREWLSTPAPSERAGKKTTSSPQSNIQAPSKDVGRVSAFTPETPTIPSATSVFLAEQPIKPTQDQIEQKQDENEAPPKSKILFQEFRDPFPRTLSGGQEGIVEHVVRVKPKARVPLTLQMIDTASASQLQKPKIKRSIDSWSISERSSIADYNDGDKPLLASDLGACPVGRWLLKVAEPPKLRIKKSITDVYMRDINSYTGDLLPEIEYPDTMQEKLPGPCRDHRDMAWRQANMTSELQIRREISSRERLGASIRAHLEAEAEKQTAPAAVEEEETPWPKADCTVRPAKVGDFQRIADIMNQESKVDKCPQILESKVITASDIEKIHASCRQALQPFIVATSPEDELLDQSKWPKDADKAYNEYVRYKKSQGKKKEVIFGFAFVKDARLGMLETSCPGSRYSCQIKMGVDRDHRRHSYGSALLDRILRSVSPYHKSLLDYTWRCEKPDLIYEDFAGHNRRQYTRVHVEILYISKEHADYTWRKGFLSKFEFKEIAFLPQAVKTDRGYESEWLNLSLWALDAQHSSRIVEN